MQRSTSTYVSLRVPNSLMRALEAELLRRENHPLYPPWSKSAFIIEALRDKIAHLSRSRKKRPNRKRKATAVRADPNSLGES